MKKAFTRKLKENGITLIALVITIIILLILAGVTIATLSGDNGILKNAAKAKEETEKAEIIEQIRLDIYGEISNNKGKELTKQEIENIAKKYGKIEEKNFSSKILKTNKGNYEINMSEIWDTEILKSGETAITSNSKYESNGKQAKIPKGFTVSDVEGEKDINEGLVVYYIPEETIKKENFWTADTDEDGTLDIQENFDQYVWIPVDGIIGEEGKTIQNAKNGEIILGRYVFNESGEIDENLTPTSIGKELKYSDTDEYYFTEDANGKGNAIAKGAGNINSFIQSVRENNGYYIARYEAGVENGGEPNLTDNWENGYADNESWTGYQGENIKLVSKSKKQPWNYVTQNKASELCQELYCEFGIYSDLINSYAWDTAILFIQSKGKESNSKTYSTQTGYSGKSSSIDDLALTGKGILLETQKEDKQCNIYDIAGNEWEWTTETYGDADSPCVVRGGSYINDVNNPNTRAGLEVNRTSWGYYSFRHILYL